MRVHSALANTCCAGFVTSLATLLAPVTLLALVVGIVVTGLSPVLPRPSAVVVTALLFGILQSRFSRKRTCATCLVWGLLLGAFIAALYGQHQLAQQLSAHCVKQPLTISGRIISLPVIAPSPFGGLRSRFLFELTEALPASCGGVSRLQLSYYGDASLNPGEFWQFSVRLKRPQGLSNPGLFDAQYWFVQEGIHAVGSVKGEGRSIPASGSAPAGLIQRYSVVHHQWRLKLRNHINSLPFSAPVRAVLAALTIADKSGITPLMWQQFAALGINHLLVISGLHVGLVAGLGLYLGRAAALPFALGGLRAAHRLSVWMPAGVALLSAGTYMALAGFTLPTQRAFVMIAVFVLGTAATRPQPALASVLYAAVAILSLNPLGALGSGFWLSFGAVLGLLWLASWQKGLPGWRRFLTTHTYMTLVMLPLGAFFFGGASVISMFANAFLIPIVGLIVVPLSLLAALAHLLGMWWEWLFWLLAGQMLELVLEAIGRVTQFNGALFFQSMPSGQLALLLGVIGCVLLVFPLQWRWRLPLLLLPLALLLPPQTLSADAQDTMQVTILDVGQGTAVVVHAGGRALLYDTGGGTPGGYTLAASVVVPYLKSLGVAKLDTLIVSHQDADHSAGVAEVLRAFPVSRLRYGGAPDRSVHARYSGRPCSAGEAWRWPQGQTFTLLAPAQEPGLSSNNGSCVLQIEYAGARVLLTGDIDGRRERGLATYWREGLYSQVLLAGHHGSKTSSYWSFLKWVLPDAVVFSAGYANRFGHPHPDIVERFSAADVRQFNTAQSGAITLEMSRQGRVSIIENRAVFRPYWM